MKIRIISAAVVLGAAYLMTTTASFAQSKLTEEDLDAIRSLAESEASDQYITGEFYFKITRPVEVKERTKKTVMVDEKSVVYDETQNANVIVTKKVPKEVFVDETVTRDEEKIFCKRIKIRLDEIANLPDCLEGGLLEEARTALKKSADENGERSVVKKTTQNEASSAPSGNVVYMSPTVTYPRVTTMMFPTTPTIMNMAPTVMEAWSPLTIPIVAPPVTEIWLPY